MKKFYFVAGVSGSGKTTIMLDLKRLLGSAINVYDFDDIGVPKDADKKWRQKILKDDKDVCLLGQI